MFAQLRSSLILSSLLLVVASGAWAQTTTIEGDVKDANGQPLKGALIVLDRQTSKAITKSNQTKRATGSIPACLMESSISPAKLMARPLIR